MTRISLCLAVVTALAASQPLLAESPAKTKTAAGAVATTDASAFDAVLKGSWRSPENMARDSYRHPAETLSFFGVKPTHTVVEITPGGGWYSEILAPYLRDQGLYVAAVVDPLAVAEGKGRDYQQRGKTRLEEKFAASPAQYGKAEVVAYSPTKPVFGAPASADVVLTFRNVHNWRSAKQAEGMFKGFYEVLKPGGVLGVVEHRSAKDVPEDDKSGYVGEAQVIALAEAAGFKLDAKSETNANPRDTKDHPNGVWTLPPSNDHDGIDAADAAKYKAIGESDRMTLRFVKR